MPSLDWDKLRVFYVTADAGSFTKAGEYLHLSQSAVSRQIGALEDRLGVPLFHRHARGLLLTEQGEILFRTAREIYAKVETTEGRIRDTREKPSGILRIATTVAFGSTWLAQNIGEFIHQYPDIEVHILVSDQEIDIAMREADVAVRFHPSDQPDLIQRALTDFRYYVYGSAAYLERKGEPKTLEDLDNHDLIIYGRDAPSSVRQVDWILHAGAHGPPRRPILHINSVYGLLQAVESGLGLAGLPAYFANSAKIVRVLPQVEGPTLTLYLTYPEEMRDSKRISVFRDFLLRNLPKIAN